MEEPTLAKKEDSLNTLNRKNEILTPPPTFLSRYLFAFRLDGQKRDSLGSDVKPPESDTDSMAEFAEGDTGNLSILKVGLNL